MLDVIVSIDTNLAYFNMAPSEGTAPSSPRYKGGASLVNACSAFGSSYRIRTYSLNIRSVAVYPIDNNELYGSGRESRTPTFRQSAYETPDRNRPSTTALLG